MMQQVIEVTGLTKEFKNITAVNDLSFSVQEGDVYGFLGQNGAGKSTTIRMLLTLITPTKGNIELFGMPLHSYRREILQQEESKCSNGCHCQCRKTKCTPITPEYIRILYLHSIIVLQ